MKRTTSRPLRAQLLAMRRGDRQLVAKTSQLTQRLEQLTDRLHELDTADLAQLRGQIDLFLMIFERRGQGPDGRKAD
jgi:hypothetical protein